MNEIVARDQLADDVVRLRVGAPEIARQRRAGQFILLQVSENGERIPLTIAAANDHEGWIELIFQAVGKTTHLLAELQPGDCLAHLVGPLGRPTKIDRVGTVACVGGGIGMAPLYPIARALKKAGNRLIVIMGARSADLLILEDEMRTLADELIVCTDDGSRGRGGLVTEPLRELCERTPPPDEVVAIGPPIMMKFCAKTTRPFAIATTVSLNAIMIDGTGMCGGCRVSVGNETKFVCVDGPEFDGHQVDFDNLMLRLSAYREREEEDHEQCHLQLAARAAEAKETS